jgi:NADH pyrophosphatase NudC (nudix superfamily)
VDAASIRFVASQPWLFPRSLLLGFTAQAENERLEVDQEEMEVPWCHGAMGCQRIAQFVDFTLRSS